ncbi:GNAT family N-acetyltransferase [Massilia sp. TSP1-1-2]|uniref:GNAT family N-acetyltransferase n=1 Tax=Massilia sp. TSP1-1-2 TaxID=2804649 RepID=UPI003CE8E5EE
MVFEIRSARPDDAMDACRVLRRSITQCCAQDHHDEPGVLQGWLGNKTPDNVASWIASPSNCMLVAIRDDELVGVSLLTQAGKLSLCYLVPEALHAGLGKAMLVGLEAQARAWGVSVLRLHSTATARDFFARNGYVLAGKEKSCYGVECDFFWKKLNAPASEAATQSARFCNCSAQ